MLKFFFSLKIMVLCLISLAQNESLELIFTAIDNGQYQQLDSVLIFNQTQNCDTTLYWPDTSLLIGAVSFVPGMNLLKGSNFLISQNYPNPFSSFTSFSLQQKESDLIRIVVSDLIGRQLVKFERRLNKGIHLFSFSPGLERFYLLTVYGKNNSKTIKMVSNGADFNTACDLQYLGIGSNTHNNKSTAVTDYFVYNTGDELLYIGYTNGIENGILGTPAENQLIEFQFATNIPCPGMPSFIYGNQEYNTIQIFSQCWMKESLNFETENSWCVYNDPEYCDEYGRLYLWESTIELCPAGWHLPSDNEWKILEGVTDSLYGIMDPVWDQSGGWRGFDTGTNLKSTSNWVYGGNGIDLFGFTAKPGGYQLPNGNNGAATIEVGFWTSTEYENETAWHRFLQFSQIGIYRYPFEKEWGLYVRCVKD